LAKQISEDFSWLLAMADEQKKEEVDVVNGHRLTRVGWAEKSAFGWGSGRPFMLISNTARLPPFPHGPRRHGILLQADGRKAKTKCAKV
jgi:hypothetical protein